MIDIEIQISISKRSSGWAINYLCLHPLTDRLTGEHLPPLPIMPGFCRFLWTPFLQSQNKCNILNAPFNVICIKNYISNNAVDRDSPMILSFHIILKFSNFINLLALSSALPPCLSALHLQHNFSTAFLSRISQNISQQYFSTATSSSRVCPPPSDLTPHYQLALQNMF